MKNWKINYWTLLFVFAVLTWTSTFITSCESTVSEPIVKEPVKQKTHCEDIKEDCPNLDSTYVIPAAEALLAIGSYKTNFKFKEKKGKNEKVNSMDVQSFHLPRCEMESMLCQVGAGDVYANLAIRPINVKGKTENGIVLVFSDTPVLNKEDGEEVEFAAGTQFFDFVHPCPPCEPD